jgi:multidrug/hemolysin transport system permease protein
MMLAMIKRNLKLYFRDRTAVFFSMLGVLIILLLYVFFLGSMLESLANDISSDHARYFMDSWIMAGVIAATSITTTLQGFGIMIDDKHKKIHRDFMVSPISRAKLVFSYVISSIVIGLVMTFLTLFIAQIYIIIYGGSLLSFSALIKMIGLIILSVSASSAMVFFAASLIKTLNAFSTLSTLLGTLIGFLTGIYIPIGNLPTTVQWVIRLFPVSHSASAMRQVMMNEAIDLDLVPQNIKIFLGIVFEYGTYEMTMVVHVLILVVTFVLFNTLSILIVSKHKIVKIIEKIYNECIKEG